MESLVTLSKIKEVNVVSAHSSNDKPLDEITISTKGIIEGTSNEMISTRTYSIPKLKEDQFPNNYTKCHYLTILIFSKYSKDVRSMLNIKSDQHIPSRTKDLLAKAFRTIMHIIDEYLMKVSILTYKEIDGGIKILKDEIDGTSAEVVVPYSYDGSISSLIELLKANIEYQYVQYSIKNLVDSRKRDADMKLFNGRIEYLIKEYWVPKKNFIYKTKNYKWILNHTE